MTSFHPREFDITDKHEKALVNRLGGYGGMILADCIFPTSPRDEKCFLIVIPGENGPVLLGAHAAFPGEQGYVDLKEIGPADETTRKHYNSENLPFDAASKIDIAIIETSGGESARPSPIWHRGLSTRHGLENFDIIRVNNANHPEEARRLIVVHALTRHGEVTNATILMDVGFTQLRDWIQEEFQMSFSGPQP